LDQSRRNLQEVRNRYSDLTDFAPVGYLILAKSGEIMEINLTGSMLLAADPRALIAEPLSRFIAASHQDSFEKHCRRCFDTNTRQTCKLNMQKLDGTPFVARLDSIAVSEDSGRSQRLRTILVESAESLPTARPLQEAEAEYRLVVDHAAEGICLAQDGRLKFVNPAVVAFTGYSEEQLLAKPLEDRPMVSARQLRTLGGRHASKRYVFRIVDNRGCITWVENTSIRVPWNDRPATLNFLTDISDRKQAEDKLRESEAQKRAILDASLDLIRYVDKDLRLIWANKALIDLVQSPPQDLIGKSCYQIGPGRNTPCEGCPTIKSGHTGQIERAVMYHRCIRGIQGDSYWDMYSVPIKNNADEIEGFLQVSRNVTAEKKTEAKLKISNRQLMDESNRRKLLSKRLIGLLEDERRQIARELHDQMGQALTALRMGFKTIHERLNTADSPVRDIVESVEDMAVQNLVKLKNIAYELRPTILDNLGLVPSVRALVQDIEKTTGLRIHFFSQQVPEHMDPDKSLTLYRIVQEALNNIIRHAGATLVFINLVSKDNSILLGVEDNGVGFDPSRILPNATGKGLLGIVIMQERVFQVDGELRIDSQIGKGTHVLVEIPL
jgi:PAS domain S-box-containing protein